MSGSTSNAVTLRHHVKMLPVVNQTTTLARFFGSTVDQVFQPGAYDPIDAYIGRRPPSYFNPTTDFYIDEPTDERNIYQLEPGMISANTTSNAINYALTYPDLVAFLSSQGANVSQQNRLFENNYYSWAPPIDIDKLVNYTQYFWFGDYNGNQLPTLTLTSPTVTYIGDGLNGEFALPISIANVSTSLETIAVYVNSVKIPDLIMTGSNTVILPFSPVNGDQIVITRYDDLSNLIIGQTTFDPTPFIDSSITLTALSSGMRIYLQDTMRIFGGWSSNVTIGNNNAPYEQLWDETYLSDGSIVDDQYAYDPVMYDTFMVDGVGISIRLTPDALINREISAQYVTIDRSSIDQNPWSLHNSWVHKDSFAWSGLSFSGLQAERPIIEFVRDIVLFDYGINRIAPIDGVLSTPNASFYGNPIPVSYITDLPMGSVSVDNGVVLFPGMRLLVAQKNKAINQLYIVNETNGLITLVSLNQNNGDIALITHASGYGAANIEMYFDGSIWKLAQGWKESAGETTDPLFQLYDINGTSLNDSSTYPNSQFNGSRIFGFALGSGSADTVLLRSLQYDNNGYIKFENDVVTRRAYTINSGVTTEITGLYCYLTVDGLPTSLWHYVANSSVQDLISIEADGTSHYDIPLNLKANPRSDDVTFLSSSDWIKHFSDELSNQVGFVGTTHGRNNWRDSLRDLGLGDQVLQHVAPLLKTMLLASETNFNLITALRFVEQEYNLFRNKFVRKFIQFDLNATLPATATPAQWVAAILADLKKAKSASFPFALSTMGGGQYYIPATPSFLGVLPATHPMVFTDNTYPVPINMIRGHDGSLTPGFTPVSSTPMMLVGYGDGITTSYNLPVSWSNSVATQDTISVYVDNIITEVKYFLNTTPMLTSVGANRLVFSSAPSVGSHIKFVRLDWRDTLLFALEQQIYASIPHHYVGLERPVFDLEYYMAGRFCPNTSGPFVTSDTTYTAVKYSRGEIQAMLRPIFERWCSQIAKVDYKTNTIYDPNDPFTWNYRGLTDRYGSSLPGHWKAIYRWYYDTVRPHIAPWEMLGFVEMPDWWSTEYTVHYGSGNTHLWNDLEAGMIRHGSRQGINIRYARPGLSKVLPVDVHGNLVDPMGAGIISQPPIPAAASRAWVVGDGGPAEDIWINSPAYRFALAQIAFLTKPARFVEMTWDSINYGFSTFGNQWIDFRTLQRPQDAGTLVHGETIPAGSTNAGSLVTIYGIQQWIADYLISLAVTPSMLGNAIRGLDVRLIHRMASFLTTDNLSAMADNFGIIPSEDTQVMLYTSPPLDTEVYSGIIIEYSGEFNGWTVVGYDARNPNFTVIPPDVNSPKGVISLATTPEPTINDWTANTYYRVGQIVYYQTYTYEAVTQHTSGPKFESRYWQAVNATYPKAPKVFKYLKGINTTVTVPYGTVFQTIQQVADFIFGWERYLISRGWTFDVMTSDGTILDWTKSVKDFLTWTQVNWTAGNFIALSPGAGELHFNAPTGTILNVEDPTTGYFGMLDRSGNPIPASSVMDSRLDGELTLLARNADIFCARLRLVDVEHALIFSNITIFNDIIYLPLFNMRQERLKVLGNRTTGWVGRLNAPGFIIEGNSLTPNFDRNVTDISEMYDIEKSLRKEFTDFARHNIGYQARDYLENLLVSELEQFEFYQGMIQQKGSPSVFSALLRSSRVSANSNIVFLEEFAIRDSIFGGPLQPRIAFLLNQLSVKRNPQIIRLGNFPQLDPTWLIMSPNDNRWVDKPVRTPFFPMINAPDPNNMLQGQVPTAGPVRVSDADYTLFHLSDMAATYSSGVTNGVATFTTGQRVWIYEDTSLATYSWNIYEVFEIGTVPCYVSKTTTIKEDSTVQGLRIYFANTINLSNTNIGQSIVVDGLAYSTPEIQGIQTIEAVNTVANWIEINVHGTKGFDFANAVASNSANLAMPTVRIFQSVRFANVTALTASTLAFKMGDLVWIDNDSHNDNLWAVYTYVDNPEPVGIYNVSTFDNCVFGPINAFGNWENVRLQPPHVDPYQITQAMVYDISTQIVANTIGVNKPVINDLVIVDPVAGILPGIAEKEIDFQTQFDPAKYTSSLVYNIVTDAWGNDQVGRVWWDMSTVRFLDPYTDQIGINDDRDLAEIDYRSANWATIAPNTSIDVYEWYKSTLTPDQYTTNAVNGVSGYTGTVYNASSPSYVKKTEYSSTYNKDITYYYYWVKGLTKVPNVSFRSESVSDIASILQSPTVADVPWFAPIMQDGMLVSGLMPYLNDTSTVLKVQTSNDANDKGHAEWKLMRPNDETSLPPDWLWRAMVNGLSQFDEAVKPLPSPDINPYRAVGTLPGQNIFKIDSLVVGDRLGLLGARESFVGIVNNILAKTPVVIDRPDGASVLSRSTPISQYLSWNRPDYSYVIEPPPVNEWDYKVYSNTERNMLLLRPEFLAAAENNTVIRVLIDGTNLKNPQWSIWWFQPSVAKAALELDVLIHNPALPQIEVLFNNADTIFTLGTSYEHSVASYAERNTLTNLTVGDRVFVEQNENTSSFGISGNGFWVVYKYDPLNAEADANGFIVWRVQSYQTSDFYKKVDWYYQDFNNGYQTITFSANNPPDITYVSAAARYLAEGTSPKHNFVAIQDPHSSSWYWEYYLDGSNGTNAGWYTVAQSQATIQLSDNFYNGQPNIHGVNTIDTKTIFTRDGSWEIKVLADVIRHGGLLTNLEINQVLFSMIHYIHSQQDDVDWVFKTSFMVIAGYSIPLTQSAIQTADISDSLISYVEEVKPYHVKIRDYTAQYTTPIDNANVHVTDFDFPAYYDNSISAYRQLDITVSSDLAIVQNNSPWKEWYANYLIPNTKDANGFSLNPVRHINMTLAFDRVTDVYLDETWDGYLSNNVSLGWDTIGWDLNESGANTAAGRIMQYYNPIAGMAPLTSPADLINTLEPYPNVLINGHSLANGYNTIDYNGLTDSNASNITLSINPDMSNVFDPNYGRFDSNRMPTTAFVDPNHPEERVALITDDAISLTVTSTGTPGAPSQSVRSFDIYGAINPVLPFGDIAQSVDGIFVYIDGIHASIGIDYTVDHFGKTITLLTLANRCVIRSFGFGGNGGIIEQHFAAYSGPIVIGSTLDSNMVSVTVDGFVQNSSEFSIVNSAVVLTTPPSIGADVAVTVWDDLTINACDVQVQTIALSNAGSFTLQHPDLQTLPPHAGTIVEVAGQRLTPPLTYHGRITTAKRYLVVDFDVSYATPIDLMIDGVYYANVTIPRWNSQSTDGFVTGYPFNMIPDISNLPSNTVPGMFVMHDRYLIPTDPNFFSDQVTAVFYETTNPNGANIDYRIIGNTIIFQNSALVNGNQAVVTTFSNAQLMDITMYTYFVSLDNVYAIGKQPQYSIVTYNHKMLTPQVDYDFATVQEQFGNDMFGVDFASQFDANVLTIPLDPTIANNVLGAQPIVVMFFNGKVAQSPSTLLLATNTPAMARMEPAIAPGGWDEDYFDAPFTLYDVQSLAWQFDYPSYPGDNTNPVQVYENDQWDYINQDPLKSGVLINDLQPTDNTISISLNLEGVSPKLWPIQLQPVMVGNTMVYQWTGNVFQMPDQANNKPGVIWVAGERIEYMTLDYDPPSYSSLPATMVPPTVILGVLERGTHGTSPINENRTTLIASGSGLYYGIGAEGDPEIKILQGTASSSDWIMYANAIASNTVAGPVTGANNDYPEMVNVTTFTADHIWLTPSNYTSNVFLGSTLIMMNIAPPLGSFVSIGITIDYSHKAGTVVRNGDVVRPVTDLGYPGQPNLHPLPPPSGGGSVLSVGIYDVTDYDASVFG